MRSQQGDFAGNFRGNLLGGDFGVHSLFLFYRTLRFDPQLVLTPTIDLALPADEVRILDQPGLHRGSLHIRIVQTSRRSGLVGGRIYWSWTGSGPLLRGTSRSQDRTALASNSRFCTKSAAMSCSNC